MRKHRIGKVIAVIIVAICAAWLLVTYVAEPLIDNRELTPIRQLHTQLQKDETASSTGGGTSNKETGGDKSLSSLGIQNLVGWISISGTQVDYPVVQSTKDNPDFYLHHNVWGRSSTAGSIYLNANTPIDQRRRKPVQIGCRLHGSAKRPSACKRSGAAGRRNFYRAVADAFGVFLVSCCGCTVRRPADRLVYLLLFA